MSRYLLLCMALLMSPFAARAGLFDEHTVLELRLTGPIETLVEQKRYPAERPFLLEMEGQSLAVNMRVRGKSRLELCDFPPLSLGFGEAGGPPGSLFEGIKSLKLVTHCLDYGAGEANALSEYAVYRILALLSDYGYRVRLFRITYADEQDGRKGREWLRYGFALEPQSDLAKRVGGERLRVKEVSLKRFEDSQMAMMYLFQYMVGSTDWSLVTARGDEHCCHNGDLVDEDGVWRYVAYDFDQAGLVGARYARPDPSLRIRNVKQRVYRGFCMDQDVVAQALAELVSHQAEILAVIDALPLLDSDQRETRRTYLEDFFERAGKPDKLLKEFGRACLR